MKKILTIRIIILIGLIFASVVVLGQKMTLPTSRNDTIELVTKLMDANGRVETDGIGYVGSPSKQYHRFVFLLFNMKVDEFVNVFNNSTGCLKVYSYMGLLHNNYSNLKSLKEKAMNDTTKIYTISGCVIDKVTIGEIFLEIDSWYQKEKTSILLEYWRNDSKFRESEFEFIIK